MKLLTAFVFVLATPALSTAQELQNIAYDDREVLKVAVRDDVISFRIGRADQFYIAAKDSVYITLENQETIALPVVTPGNAYKSENRMVPMYWYGVYDYQLTSEARAKLKNHPVESFRFPLYPGKKTVYKVLKPKHKVVIQNMLNG